MMMQVHGTRKEAAPWTLSVEVTQAIKEEGANQGIDSALVFI